MTMIEIGAASRFDPMLIEHCLELAEEFLEENKPVVAPRPLAAMAAPRAWYVLQTVMHGEDKVIGGLGALGFESYAPMMRKEVQHKRSRRPVMKTFRLFNRYIFALLPVDVMQWKTVRSIEEYDGVLGANGVPCPVAAAEIERFKRAEAACAFDITKAARFPIGSRLRAVAGPFGGFSGLVDSFPGKELVRAMIEIFGALRPVDFPFDMVEPE